VFFRYRLDGVDNDWQNVGARREAYYTKLRPGQYKFHVIASNNDGVWNEAGASLDFAIAPTYYQTTWFRATCVAAFLVFLWGLYRLRLYQLAQRFNIRLEERVNERTRIARELHDTLLQSFHGLLFRFQAVSDLLPERPVEAKQIVESVVEQAAEAITEGRDAVQDLRSSTAVTHDLAAAITVLGQELAASESSNHCAAFRIEVEGTPRDLHPILRDEVYRIAGEALRNAFNHAQARQIEVEIRYDERQLQLLVRDDGTGLDPAVLSEEGRPGHWGLHGMRERAKLVGGRLDVWSRLDSGTELELSIPASRGYAISRAPRLSWLFGRLRKKPTTMSS
jgi:signal transduction histidine kinase